ncbi:type VI secretion system-associated protein TagF [Azohydromonas aeria]|uniref:type VI secretion system-associated protein TagF n=1 Tax=Azohydromonas aeria TaxID=2590212 RepID=UPI0018DFB0B8|nr:type VI secretion system-associated protein TagF [Azohydromonas aeria]
MSRPGPVTPCWFGKLPSRADFVRSPHQGTLTRLLDQWLSRALARLAEDPRWKQRYDRMVPAHFALLGVRRRVAVAGHLLPSTDASGRRFPFAVLAAFEPGAPLPFMTQAPLLLQGLWPPLEDVARRACAARDAAPVLAQAQRLQLQLAPAPGTAAGAGAASSVGALQALLQRTHPAFDLRRTLLALGLLLQPVPGSGRSRLDRSLRLPLPADGPQAAAVAAWWMRLVAPFLARGDFELLLLWPRAPQPSAASLVLGFDGASPAALQPLFSAGAADESCIELHAPRWVDAALEREPALRRFDAWLRQDALSLPQAAAFFDDCFTRG